MRKSEYSNTDKIVSAVSYITMGWGGLFYLIYKAFKHATLSRFARYNILQSIFMSFLYFILAYVFGIIFNLLSYIPYINLLIAKIVLFFNSEFIFQYSIIQIFIIGIVLYMALASLNGKYPRLYMVSNLIDKQLK
jgi:hypothetical protein